MVSAAQKRRSLVEEIGDRIEDALTIGRGPSQALPRIIDTKHKAEDRQRFAVAMVAAANREMVEGHPEFFQSLNVQGSGSAVRVVTWLDSVSHDYSQNMKDARPKRR